MECLFQHLALDHDDFGLNQSKIIVIESNKFERDMRMSLRNLRKLICAGKPAQHPTFPHPAPVKTVSALRARSNHSRMAKERAKFDLRTIMRSANLVQVGGAPEQRQGHVRGSKEG
jgi:hypothetical protein